MREKVGLFRFATHAPRLCEEKRSVKASFVYTYTYHVNRITGVAGTICRIIALPNSVLLLLSASYFYLFLSSLDEAPLPLFYDEDPQPEHPHTSVTANLQPPFNMGAGASAHDMYASAGDDTAESQLRSLLPPGSALPAALLGDLKEYNFLVDAIAMDDAVLLSDAIVSDHRNYDKLSERLLTKTRGQLQRTRRMYSASSALSSGKNKELLPDLQSMFQGQYGAFLSNLFRTKDEYNVHQLETALSGLG